MYTSILEKIPAAIAAVFLLAALCLIYFRSKNITRSEFLKIFRRAKYLQLWVLVVVIILTGTFGILHRMDLKKSNQAIIALNYSEASQAQNSNGTRYNMAEIICDEVLKNAIEIGAFEDVTVKQLKQCLSVYPYVQGDVNDESAYHISTEFVVEYHATKDTQHLDPENVIKMIVSAYKTYYIEKYTDNFQAAYTVSAPDYNSMEYMDIVSYFEKEADQISNYLYELSAKSSSFVTQNNTTFSAIAGKVYQLKETQIEENLKSYILQNGIARNRAEYVERLTYQNNNTDFDRRKNAASFDVCNDAIQMYAEEMTRVVLVPTWDEAGKYYMGRTKVGIDELAVNATDYSDQVASDEKTIKDNKLIIRKMKNGSEKASVYQQADDMIASIDQSLHSFADEAIAAGREFASYQMNQCIAVSIYGVSLVQLIKDMVLFAVFAYLSVMLFAIAKSLSKRE